MKNIFKLILAVGFCNLLGNIGSIFTAPNIAGWYATLAKPSFNPPNWLFGPVWTLLFSLLGVSLFLLIKDYRGLKTEKIALIFFTGQFVLNILWSVIFFGMRNPLLAFFEIIILWWFIFFTMIYFYRVSRPAGLLFIPYLLWVSFAAVLNFAIWTLN